MEKKREESFSTRIYKRIGGNPNQKYAGIPEKKLFGILLMILLGIIVVSIAVVYTGVGKGGIEERTVVSDVIKIVDESVFSYSDHGGSIIGEIKNVGDEPVRIKSGLYGLMYYFYEEEKRVGSQSGDCGLEVLEPGQKAPFRLSFPFKEREFDKCQLERVDWESIEDNPEMDLYKGLEIINDSGQITEGATAYPNTYTVTGEIKNTGNVVISGPDISLAGTLYNSEGNIIATGSNHGVATWSNTHIDMPSDLELEPGQTADFEIEFGSLIDRKLKNIGDYSIQVQAVLNL